MFSNLFLIMEFPVSNAQIELLLLLSIVIEKEAHVLQKKKKLSAKQFLFLIRFYFIFNLAFTLGDYFCVVKKTRKSKKKKKKKWHHISVWYDNNFHI